ncbi:hypothetical protein HU200_062263 [Digitaria exilis]|uniref:Uncharacterized protein n=1 Tax=Digitaria exilis TaxID=1010633 RepID=A0A835AAW4_9POAL|nr:hypothetical protein HU200_062263 [Digitaria exilis]
MVTTHNFGRTSPGKQCSEEEILAEPPLVNRFLEPQILAEPPLGTWKFQRQRLEFQRKAEPSLQRVKRSAGVSATRCGVSEQTRGAEGQNLVVEGNLTRESCTCFEQKDQKKG